jgi:hypothetical protein
MVTATVDDKKRIRLPSAKPGQVFAVEVQGEAVILTPVKKVADVSPLAGLKPLTREEAERCWGKGVKHELDELESHCALLPAIPPEE